jgi:hypothetical protein
MATREWDDADYPGATAANLIDDFARDAREDISDRWIQGGIRVTAREGELPMSYAPDNHPHDGKRCVGWEVSTPSNDDLGWVTLVWDFAGSTAVLRQYGTSHATKPGTLECAGSVSIPTGFEFEGIARGAWIRAIISDALPVASTFHPRVLYKVPDVTDAPDRTLEKAMLVAKVKPTGDPLIVEIWKHPNPAVTVDRFSEVGATLLTTLTLATGTNFAVENTGIAETLEPGDELVVEYGDTTGGASDISIIAQIE